MGRPFAFPATHGPRRANRRLVSRALGGRKPPLRYNRGMSGAADLTQQPPEAHLARFGLSAFRPGQRDVIAAVLAGRDCLCIMPTGGGKSLCYQLPSVARPGMTLVVSPLIALMKDQVDGLSRLGIAATFINSSLPPAEAFERMDAMAEGRYDLVYIAPERLRSSLFLEKLALANVQLVAVDEAHCISQWGHDFRPDYARLGRFREKLGYPQTIALTATATPDVQIDVARQLRLREPQTFITGFARPNLSFEVQPVLSEIDHDRCLEAILATTPGAGIIYCATRKRCEELAPVAAAVSGRRAGLYHAGLEPDVRRRVQDDFRSGKSPIIVATNAFGMGIDKPDLRFVVHYNIPGTLEAYYQEAGRAGRDGQPSKCVLLFSQRDRRIQEYFIESRYPEPYIVEQVYDLLREIDADPIEMTLDEIREELNLPIRSEGVAACEKLLAGVGVLERLDARQNMAAVRIDSDLPTLVDLLPKEAKNQRRVLQALEREVGGRRFERVYFPPRKIAQMTELDPAAVGRALKELSKLQALDYVPPFRGRAVHMLVRDKPFEQLGIDFDEQERLKANEYAKLDRMIAYAQAQGCRQLEILEYFGDPDRRECGSCDNCRARAANQASGKRQGAAKTGAASTAAMHADADPSRSPDGGLAALTQAVRIVLSGVARMKGRFGKQLLAKMLVGSQAKEVAKSRLDKLSTFGLLRYLKEPQAIALIDALLSARLLMQVEEQAYRPLVRLTPRGEEVMKGHSPLTERLSLPAEVLGQILAAGMSAAQGRKGQASKLQAKAVEPPEHDLDPFAEANAALAADNESYEPQQEIAGRSAVANQPPHYWTWRVLSAGFSADECRQIRGLDQQTLIDHLLAAGRAGLAIDAGWVLSSEQLTALRGGPSNGRPAVSRAEADLYRLSRQAARR